MLFNLIIFLTIISIYSSSLITYNLFTLSLYRGTSKRSNSYSISYDQYGSLPQIQEISDAIEKCNTIIAINLIDHNSIIVSFKKNNISSNITHLFDQNEEIKSQYDALHPIGKSENNQYILHTGLIKDCQYIRNFLNEISLNYTEKFGSYPSIRYLSNELATHIQKYSTNPNVRPLIIQAYLIGPMESHKLYFIDNTGLSNEITAGISGKGTKYGIKKLIDKMKSSVDIEQAITIIREIFDNDSNFNEQSSTENEKINVIQLRTTEEST